jgi:hypothetical protein
MIDFSTTSKQVAEFRILRRFLQRESVQEMDTLLIMFRGDGEEKKTFFTTP